MYQLCTINLVLLATLSCINLTGQSVNTEGAAHQFNYELLVEAPLYECNILGTQIDTAVVVAPQGAVFTKIDQVGDQLVVRFWLWKKSSVLQQRLNYADSSKNDYRYFLLSTEEFNLKAIPRYRKNVSFTMGVAHIPFRLRSGPFDFSNHLSIGSSFGAKMQLSPYQDISLNIVGGVSIANITLDSLGTNGRAESGETAPAFSPSLGVVLEVSKAQVGLYLGWDLLSGKEKKIWLYQGKPWLSIGVGMSIFSAPTPPAPGIPPNIPDAQ